MKQFFTLFLLMSPVLALPSSAQDSAIFTETINVEVVNVDVYVTDEKGRAVSGLTPEDFVLLQDGKPVELTNFEAIDETAPSPEAATVPQDQGAALAVAPPRAKPLNLVVFVDNHNLRPQTRNRVLKQLRGFLQGFAGAQIMVVTHDLGLQIRKPLASKLDSFDDLFRTLSRLSTRGPLTDNFTRQTLERIQSYGCTSEASVEARSYAQQIYNDTVNTLSALRRTMESLSGLEGRKAVLYVSDGLPLRPGEDIFLYLSKICGDISGNTFEADDVAAELRKVTTAANTYGVTFHTLEAAGLRGFTSVSVESTNAFQTPTMDFVQNANVQDTLFNLASETGGQAVLNANDLRVHLDHIARDLRTYYSLGYSPRQSGSGRIHNLRVEVKRPGLKARCRKTYRDSTPEERILARLDATLWHGIEDNRLGVQIDVGKAQPEGKGQYLVPVQVKIPVSSLTLLPQGDAHAGRFSVLVSSRDEDGRFSPPQRVEVPVTLTAGEMKKKLLTHDFKLVTRKGKTFLAMAVRDDLGGDMAFLQRSSDSGNRAAAATSRPRAGEARIASRPK